MSFTYQALVEETAEQMIEGGTSRIPLDSLTRAYAAGFVVDAFEEDVAEAYETLRQPSFQF